MQEKDFFNINKEGWNNRTGAHYDSEFYDVEGFLKGSSSLKQIELELLGSLEGKELLHLQCHFGQDSISLAREGAKVTGIDISDQAIDKAKHLAQEAGVKAHFITSNVYDIDKHLNQQYDVIFSSYGVITWLPDLQRWADLIDMHLKPGGKFVFVEFHPAVWMFNDQFTSIDYSYFNTGPIIENESGSYADKDASIAQDYVVWNHSLQDVIEPLLSNKLTMESFKEYDFSPYDCFENTVKIEESKYQINGLEGKIPLCFSLVMKK